MKKEIKIIVFEDDDIGDDIPKTPKEFIEFWQKKIELIPAEFADTAKIEIEGNNRWECGYIAMVISYERIETDGEYSARIKKEDDRRKFVENQELRQLENLKAKYGV